MRDLGTECARGSPPRPSDRRGASDCTQGPSLTAAILGLGPSRASRPRHFEWPHDVAGGLNLLWNQSIGQGPSHARVGVSRVAATTPKLRRRGPSCTLQRSKRREKKNLLQSSDSG